MTHSSSAEADVRRIYAGSLLNARGNRQFGDVGLAGVLLHERDETRVEEADLEEHEERQRAVNLVRERVENRRREVQAERELDERLDGDRRVVLLADPLIARGFDAVFRRALEVGLLIKEGFKHGPAVVDREADADRHQKRQVPDPRDPVAMNLALADHIEVADRERRREE